MPDDLKTAKKVVGAKQLRRALNEGQVRLAFLADDADPQLIRPLEELCQASNVEIVRVPSMQKLGQACGIHVKAACAALLR